MAFIVALLNACAVLSGAPAHAQLFPAGTAIPPPGTEEAAVLAPINAVFAAFAAGDAEAMLKHVYPDGRVSAPGLGDGGTVREQSWAQFAERIKPGGEFQESITDPAIEIDGDVAMVWARFVVRKQGRVANCGFDHFDLVREKLQMARHEPDIFIEPVQLCSMICAPSMDRHLHEQA